MSLQPNLTPLFLRAVVSAYDIATKGVSASIPNVRVPTGQVPAAGQAAPAPSAVTQSAQQEPKASMEDLRVPAEVLATVTRYWTPGSFSVGQVGYWNPRFQVTHSYSTLVYRGVRRALLYVDPTFVDRPAGELLKATLKDLSSWLDTLEQKREESVCVISKSVDAPALYIRTLLGSCNHGLSIRFVPWRDLDAIESLAEERERRSWVKQMLGLVAIAVPKTVEFEIPDLRRLTNILASTADFVDGPQGRKNLLIQAGLGQFAQGDLLGPMNPNIAAGVYLDTLAKAGLVGKQGTLAVGALLAYVRDIPSLPSNDKSYIEGIIDRYVLVPMDDGEEG